MRIQYSEGVYLDVVDVTLNQVGQQFVKVTPKGEIEYPNIIESEEELDMVKGKAVAGETINMGDLVAVDQNGTLWKADKDIAGRQDFVGIALANVTAGGTVEFQTSGVFELKSGQFPSAGGTIFMGNAGAMLVNTVPTTGVSLKIGYFLDNKHIVIQAISRMEL